MVYSVPDVQHVSPFQKASPPCWFVVAKSSTQGPVAPHRAGFGLFRPGLTSCSVSVLNLLTDFFYNIGVGQGGHITNILVVGNGGQYPAHNLA